MGAGKYSRRFGALVTVSGSALVAMAVLVLVPVQSAKAVTNCGDVQVSGSNWASGNGVDVHYNGADDGTGNDCKANNPPTSYDPYNNLNPDAQHNGGVPQDGLGWQCVEMVYRLYQTRGWSFPSVLYAYQIYDNATGTAYSRMAQGSITIGSIVPGDLLVTHEATYGHVMAVDSVDTTHNLIYAIDQNGADSGKTTVAYNSTTKQISDGSYYQFSGVVHSTSNKLTNGGSGSASTPSAVSRSSSDMAVFYSDANNKLVNFSWNSSSGWSTQSWSDTGLVYGQPAVDSRTSDSMDVFYYTGEHKLVTKGWTASGGWTGPTALLSSDVAGDPAVAVRDSNDMQVFYLDLEGDIKSIYWTASGGWNTNPQNLYSSTAKTNPTATSRSSDSMEVFFGKNNNNIVHLGWTSEYGWNASDWTANMNLTSKPTAITRNGGGDMSAYFQQTSSNVGEQAWDWQNGWSGQSWTAQLAGSPSATAGVNNVIDDFYRETGGNVVDRYFTGSGWYTTNIVGPNGATGNPDAITRGSTSQEVFYWNGTSLMDDNWNTTSQSWNGGTKIN